MEEYPLKSDDIDVASIREYGLYENAGICRNLYHGTAKHIALSIIKSKAIEIHDKVGYIGCGFYCFHLDIEACKIFAKSKYDGDKIAVIHAIANLGNVLFIYKELYEILLKKSKEISGKDTNSVPNNIGLLIERVVIKRILQQKLGINVDSVARIYTYASERPALMYCLRNKEYIKSLELRWAEQ
jgi:hypothetical protein